MSTTSLSIALLCFTWSFSTLGCYATTHLILSSQVHTHKVFLSIGLGFFRNSSGTFFYLDFHIMTHHVITCSNCWFLFRSFNPEWAVMASFLALKKAPLAQAKTKMVFRWHHNICTLKKIALIYFSPIFLSKLIYFKKCKGGHQISKWVLNGYIC